MKNPRINKKSWQEMTPAQRSAAIVGGVIQVALFFAAQIDMFYRPAEQIRGKKIYWRLAAFINFIGPLAYFIFGIRRDGCCEEPVEAIEPIEIPA